MLTDETLKEVGRFALEFSALDTTVSHFAADILECTEWSVAEQITATGTLGRKLDVIKDVGKILATKYTLDPIYNVLTAQIASVRKLVDDRNTVLHGSLTITRGQNPIVQAKKNSLELTPQKMSGLVGQIDPAVTGLISAYFDFMDAVKEARKP